MGKIDEEILILHFFKYLSFNQCCNYIQYLFLPRISMSMQNDYVECAFGFSI